MAQLIPHLIRDTVQRQPQAVALQYRDASLTYEELWALVQDTAQAVLAAGIGRGERVAIYLPKQFETVAAIFGASAAGAVFVPVNPALKGRQVAYILADCNVQLLVTSNDRLVGLAEDLRSCPDLKRIVVTNDKAAEVDLPGVEIETWDAFMARGGEARREPHRVIDADMTAILYTSGSTGMPKGVVLSHRNMVAGAKSVAEYLRNNPDDVILSVLPLSFDAGLSQLTTGFWSGARVVLMNYLLPRDVIKAVARYGVTAMTCVPPLWVQLADLDWPEEAVNSVRYISSTGGRMPRPVIAKLRERLPRSEVIIMYGLTESFRSTYLPFSELDRRPDSMGKAIPNAEVMVVRPDGTPCEPGEVGELVHRGALVSMGYWNDPERTAQRFRPAPGQPKGIPIPEIAVWSGDKVKMDEDGFLYFVGRDDEMIKTSGYRVSPTELEEVLYGSGLVGEVVALGIDDAALGQSIAIVATAKDGGALDSEAILAYCRKNLPTYMVPHHVLAWPELPRNPNGKLDRKAIGDEVRASLAKA